jgi:hypothetical protein
MAIGPLVDYSRFAPLDARLAVLLPSLPRDELRKLLAHAGVLMYVTEGNEFVLMNGDGNRVRV